VIVITPYARKGHEELRYSSTYKVIGILSTRENCKDVKADHSSPIKIQGQKEWKI
jgi:hypothetical protein